MKKYLQIIVVLGAFFLLVYLKNLHIVGDEGGNVAAPTPGSNPVSLPTTQPTSGQQNTIPATPTTGASSGQYKDGTYTGSTEDAFYGNVQVQAVISGGKLTDVVILQYPNDNRTSNRINSQAMPLLKQEALTAQGANIDIISGASDSSPAFARSLANALSQAK